MTNLKIFFGELSSILFIFVYSLNFTLAGMGLIPYDPIGDDTFEKSLSPYLEYEELILDIRLLVVGLFLLSIFIWIILYFKVKI